MDGQEIVNGVNPPTPEDVIFTHHPHRLLRYGCHKFALERLPWRWRADEPIFPHARKITLKWGHIARVNVSGMVHKTTATQATIAWGNISWIIIIMHPILFPQRIEADSGVIMLAPDFWIVVTVGCHTITINGVIMVIPKSRIAMMVDSQSITVISRIEKEYGMVGLTIITIPGVVCQDQANHTLQLKQMCLKTMPPIFSGHLLIASLLAGI